MLLLAVMALSLGSLALAKTVYEKWQLAVVDRAIALVDSESDSKKAS